MIKIQTKKIKSQHHKIRKVKVGLNQKVLNRMILNQIDRLKKVRKKVQSLGLEKNQLKKLKLMKRKRRNKKLALKIKMIKWWILNCIHLIKNNIKLLMMRKKIRWNNMHKLKLKFWNIVKIINANGQILNSHLINLVCLK